MIFFSLFRLYKTKVKCRNHEILVIVFTAIQRGRICLPLVQVPLFHQVFDSKYSITGVFVNPTNGQLGGSQYTLLPNPSGAPDDYFVPPLTSHSGANYYDRSLSTLFVIVRGPEPVEIRVMQVIQVKRFCFTITYVSHAKSVETYISSTV